VLSKAYYGKGYQRGNLDYLRTLHGKPLGNGPYVYDKYIPGQEIRFTPTAISTVAHRRRRALSTA
jgi:peptide/nickel transport system substrate-binding protein